MCLFHFVTVFHTVIYVVFSLTGTKPALHALRNRLQGWVSCWCRRSNSARDARCDVAPGGCASIAPGEGSFRLGEWESLAAALMHFAYQKSR